ncbi:hypothetical protein SAMN05216268_13638 [Streptomyces yunnanensis]|uniref:Uncharacterized protein n=1 Tax=Streptomyces yunnanensis TaxID=156453 RepID=A0A9X8R0B4_9ACTN|nr:hypothetical protein SAMN05216268_13638 [Streptomyces yunnanensis]
MNNSLVEMLSPLVATVCLILMQWAKHRFPPPPPEPPPQPSPHPPLPDSAPQKPDQPPD